MTKPFHVGMFMSYSAPDWQSMWSGNAGNEWLSGEFYTDMARQMERAGFDFIMFADLPAITKSFDGALDLKYGTGLMADPMPLMVKLADATQHIGLICTGSTSYHSPYNMARVMATLDHLTKGRIAWNIVTSSGDFAAQNYGLDHQIPHSERYAMSDEFVEVVKKLWDSWDPGAMVMDRDARTLVAQDAVRPIDHVGKYFKVRGPLNMPPGPQRHPVLCQAGGSDAGREVGAKHADIVVATNPRLDYLKEYREDIRARAEKYGRDPDSVKVMCQITPVLGQSQEAAAEAWEQRFGFKDPVAVERVLSWMSGQTGIDFSKFDLDAPFPQGLKSEGHASILEDWMTRNKHRTLRESLYERAQFGPTLHGTPASVADQLAAIVDETDMDGFLFMSPSTRRFVDEMCSGLMPELRRKGLAQQDYGHSTFRENTLAF